MTLPYSPSRALFHGNGLATHFPFYFRVWDASQLIVIMTDRYGVENVVTDYALTFAENGGTLIYTYRGAPLPMGYKLAILRDMPFTQGIDLISGTRFDPKVIEDQLDRATAERQQLKEALSRAVLVEPTSTVLPDELLQDLRKSVRDAELSAGAALGSEQAAAYSEAAALGSEQAAEASATAALASQHAAAQWAAEAAQDVSDAVERVMAEGDTQVARVESTGNAHVDHINAMVSVTPAANALPKAGADAEDGGLSSLWGVYKPGDFAWSMRRANNLNAGWYFCNGARFALGTPQQKILDALPAQFKTDWGITTNASGTNLPNMFHLDGRGFFVRAVDGTTRQVGSAELDAVQEAAGTLSVSARGSSLHHQCAGTFYGADYGGSLYSVGGGGGGGSYYYSSAFALSNVARTSTETRPRNIGMTPALFLGV